MNQFIYNNKSSSIFSKECSIDTQQSAKPPYFDRFDGKLRGPNDSLCKQVFYNSQLSPFYLLYCYTAER